MEEERKKKRKKGNTTGARIDEAPESRASSCYTFLWGHSKIITKAFHFFSCLSKYVFVDQTHVWKDNKSQAINSEHSQALQSERRFNEPKIMSHKFLSAFLYRICVCVRCVCALDIWSAIQNNMEILLRTTSFRNKTNCHPVSIAHIQVYELFFKQDYSGARSCVFVVVVWKKLLEADLRCNELGFNFFFFYFLFVDTQGILTISSYDYFIFIFYRLWFSDLK